MLFLCDINVPHFDCVCFDTRTHAVIDLTQPSNILSTLWFGKRIEKKKLRNEFLFLDDILINFNKIVVFSFLTYNKHINNTKKCFELLKIE